ncbi:MAG: hypothetical protein NC548_27280 [Lachnospiraceae bacterium]|nr:hypothetical protein [Lachnospiraceae bacterium]
MDWTQILTAAISAISAIAVAWLSHTVKKDNAISRDAAELQHAKIMEEIDGVKRELDDNNMRTLRLDLLHAIETDPNNQIVILELAQKYFVEMKGNCYMSKVFQDWANEHRVDITSIFNGGK